MPSLSCCFGSADHVIVAAIYWKILPVDFSSSPCSPQSGSPPPNLVDRLEELAFERAVLGTRSWNSKFGQDIEANGDIPLNWIDLTTRRSLDDNSVLDSPTQSTFESSG